MFANSKLQIIASLLYKIGAHFGQYFGYLSPKVSEDQKKGLRRKSVLISVSFTGICTKKKVKTKKKGCSPQSGADFRQYYGNLSQKEGEAKTITKKRSSPQIRTDFANTKQNKVLV